MRNYSKLIPRFALFRYRKKPTRSGAFHKAGFTCRKHKGSTNNFVRTPFHALCLQGICRAVLPIRIYDSQNAKIFFRMPLRS